MTNVRVKIEEIRESGLKFHFKIAPSELDLTALEQYFQSPFVIEFVIDKLKKEFIITGLFNTEVTYQCSRCLEKFKTPLNEEFQFVFSKEIKDLENPAWYNKEDDSVDVGEEIRECALLSIAPKPLCSETCKGLCTICGINLNLSTCDCVTQDTDSRLTKLDQFLEKGKS
jgi:uncharacterized protein